MLNALKKHFRMKIRLKHSGNKMENYNLFSFRSGNVSQGAQEIFQELPHEYVPPEMLQKVADHGGMSQSFPS